MTSLRIVCDCGAIIRAVPDSLVRGQFVQCAFCAAWLRVRVDSGHHSTPVAVGGGSNTSGAPAAAAPQRGCSYCGDPLPCDCADPYLPVRVEQSRAPATPGQALLGLPSTGMSRQAQGLWTCRHRGINYLPISQRGVLSADQRRTLDAMIRARQAEQERVSA